MFAYVVLVFEIVFFTAALLWILHRNSDKFKVSNDIWGVYQEHPTSIGEEEDLPVITFSRISTGVTVDKLSHTPHEK
ncbi:MAG: hypothetical protein P4L53_16015 [Candidatus Obscuribacterales bacterium]|nr:hypothetical protein [Candidatus Obscuribacterales bacterium]